MEQWNENYSPIQPGSDRDTHFANYAKLVVMEIAESPDGVLMTDILTRRFYDLVCYSQQFMPGVENVPDITSWDDLAEQGE